ncbi:hypothetical protein [Candidatus Nitrosocosmicus sp. T]
MNKKIALGFIMPIILASVSLAIMTMSNLSVFAQNMTTAITQGQELQQQSQSLNQTADVNEIKQHLTDAITALDNGNNTKAAEQIELADEQLEILAGTDSDEENEDGDEDEEETEEVEEESESEERSAGQS